MDETVPRPALSASAEGGSSRAPCRCARTCRSPAQLLLHSPGPTAAGGEARNKPPDVLVKRKYGAYQGLVVELGGERHGSGLVGGLVAASPAFAALTPNQRRQSAKNDRGGELRQMWQRPCASVQAAMHSQTNMAYSPPLTRHGLGQCCERQCYERQAGAPPVQRFHRPERTGMSH